MPAASIRVAGAVQGVGFRPFCYREAAQRGLVGFVLNDLGGVRIHLEGASEAIDGFVQALRTNPPAASRITGIEIRDVEEEGLQDFRIVESRAGEASQELEVSADLATCQACKREILTFADRRFRYAFTNCTDCGPRYTIIGELPYDRPQTVMREFRMCASCQREYDDPLDRRFHAQPNACAVCGPEFVLLDASGRVARCQDPLQETVRLILSGKIVAVKGLGGYHLMCDGTNPETVARLRRRKRRPHTPLAVMCRDLKQARELAVVSPDEAAVLTSSAAPILLLGWNPETPQEIREALAPLNPGIGVMLACTPLHHLLFAVEVEGGTLGPVVATSANRGSEPIIAEERILFDKLGGVIDAALAHNRSIANRIDDSVGFVCAGVTGVTGTKSPDENVAKGQARAESAKESAWIQKIHLVRRARGFAPAPIQTRFEFKPSLAVGAEMKASFAVADGHRMWLSPHIGELRGRASIEFFEETLRTYLRWFGVTPELVVCDEHPDYLSTRWAERYAGEKGIPLVRIQHHHAHAAAVMFEHQIGEQAIGLVLDGTGYGPDGSIWGCELLHVTDQGARYKRLGHLKPLPLVGGDQAIGKPRRMAAGVVADLIGFKKARELFGKEGDIASKAQAPIALESLCPLNLGESQGYPFIVGDDLVIDPEPCFCAIIQDMENGVGLPEISAQFHIGFARVLFSWLLRAREITGTSAVALSGGVFTNRTLVRLLSNLANEPGGDLLSLYLPRLIPATDGGLAAGQLLAARSKMNL
jgi:hydrogenase maturation protein HypF